MHWGRGVAALTRCHEHRIASNRDDGISSVPGCEAFYRSHRASRQLETLMQIPPLPFDAAEPPLDTFDKVFLFLTLYAGLLTVVGALLLPRPWFVWCFKTLFPFMPERLEDIGKPDWWKWWKR